MVFKISVCLLPCLKGWGLGTELYFSPQFCGLWLMSLCARQFFITGVETLLVFTPSELAVFPWTLSYSVR